MASAEEANPLPTMDLSEVAGQNAAAAAPHTQRAAAPTVQLTPAPTVQLAPVTVAETPQIEVNGIRQLASHFQVMPHAEVRVTADDNIYISKHKEGDVYFTLAAGLAAGWGDFRNELNSVGILQQDYDGLLDGSFGERNYVFGGYTPSVTVFARHSGENTLDHAAVLGAQGQFGNLAVSFHSQFRTFSQPELDVGDRVKQTLFNTSLLTRYDVSDKTSVEVDFRNTTYHYRSLEGIDSSNWENRDFLDYQLFPKTRVGVGGAIGYLDVQTGPSQMYEQALGRVAYDTTHKLAFNAQGGIEFRQPLSSGGQQKVNPVFGLGATYEPFDGTTLTLTGQRVVRSSIIFTGQDVAMTNVILAVSQRLFDKTTLTLSSTYQHLDYQQTAARRGYGLNRTDNAIDLHADFGFRVTKWVGLNIAYDYNQDTSTLSQFGFQENRATLQMDVLF